MSRITRPSSTNRFLGMPSASANTTARPRGWPQSNALMDSSIAGRSGASRPRPRISKPSSRTRSPCGPQRERAGVLHREQARQIAVVRVDGPCAPVGDEGDGVGRTRAAGASAGERCAVGEARAWSRRRTGTPSARRVTSASDRRRALACMRLRGTSTRSRTGSTAWSASDGTPRPTAGRGDVATGSRGAPRAPGRTACPRWCGGTRHPTSRRSPAWLRSPVPP